MRVLSRLLAILIALALIALAVLVPVDVVRAALHQRTSLPWHTWVTAVGTDTWQAPWVRAVLIGVAVVGLLLLLGELKPRRPGLLPLAPLTEDVDASTTRRSLQQALRRAAVKVDGIVEAKAAARRGAVKVRAVARLREPAGLDEQVREHVAARLESLHLARTPRLVVRLRRERTR